MLHSWSVQVLREPNYNILYCYEIRLRSKYKLSLPQIVKKIKLALGEKLDWKKFFKCVILQGLLYS